MTTVAYKLPNSRMTLNYLGTTINASDDGFFRVTSGSADEAALLAAGGYMATAGAIPGDATDIGMTPAEVAGVRSPRWVAQSLVSGYESRRAENIALGHYLEGTRTLATADTPTISASSTVPSSDTTDPCTQRIYLFGSDLSGVTTEMTYAQSVLGMPWVRGYSPGAYNRGEAGTYRLSSTVGYYGAAGNQGTRPSDGYAYDAGINYVEFILDGDVFETKIETGPKFYIWVNDALVTTQATVGSGITYNTAFANFSSTVSGHGYVKVKFTSVARRTIKIAHYAANGFGDLWTRVTSTLTPRTKKPIQWVHFGDSFSQYAGLTTGYKDNLTEYLYTAFGSNINFINTAQASTSFANSACIQYGDTPSSGKKPSFYLNYKLNWSVLSPDIITCLIGHNDSDVTQSSVVSRMTEMFTALRAAYPSAIIIAFTSNASPALITSGAAATIETLMISTIKSLGLNIITVPMQTDSTYGAFLRGSGNIGSLKADGNCDLYTYSDATHPSIAGHKATGLFMAERMYELLRSLSVTPV